MPRRPNEVAALVSDLAARLDRLVAAARQEGRDAALEDIRRLVGGPLTDRAVAPPVTRTRVRRATRLKDGRASSWSRLTPSERLARVNAIRAGKGLPPRKKL